METIRSMIVYNIDLQCGDSNWDTQKKIVQSQHFFDIVEFLNCIGPCSKKLVPV